jgi:hypothetical protein
LCENFSAETGVLQNRSLLRISAVRDALLGDVVVVFGANVRVHVLVLAVLAAAPVADVIKLVNGLSARKSIVLPTAEGKIRIVCMRVIFCQNFPESITA